MIKILALILLLPTFTWAGPEMLLMLTNGMGTVSGSCSGTAFLTQDTHDAGITLGSTDALRYAGFVNTSGSSQSICSMDLYLRENNSLSGKTISVERWSVTAVTYGMIAKQGATIATLDATTLPSTIGYVSIPFGSTITLGNNEAIVITLGETTGVTNNATVATKNGTNPTTGQATGSWSSAGVANVSDIDDIRVKLYGP